MKPFIPHRRRFASLKVWCLKQFSGSEFCKTPSRNGVLVSVFYVDLKYDVIVENQAYPIGEMFNELAGIVGLYFGFSVLTIANLLQTAVQRVQKISDKRRSGRDTRIAQQNSVPVQATTTLSKTQSCSLEDEIKCGLCKLKLCIYN